MPEFEKTNCLVCDANEYLPYSHTGQFGLPTHVVICKKCGFSYLNPRWSKERYHDFYSAEYDKYYRPEVISSSYNYDPAQSIKDIVTRGSGILDFSREGINVLDIGAGMGDSLNYLKSINPGARYYAIESSEFCVKQLESNEISVITQDVDDDWHVGKEKKFDIVIMRHVLEHFLIPSNVLSKVKKVLKDDGCLYIAVPDAKNPTKPLLRHFFRVVHVSYFSSLSLSNLLHQIGFQTKAIVEAQSAKEIYCFCRAGKKQELSLSKNEWLIQKTIYDRLKQKELYYRFRQFIAKNIILRLR